jgi:hypothetical protein
VSANVCLRELLGLQQVPAEIWQQIFSLACLDGGFTGCSLSIASRLFHEVSASTRLQSVAVTGVARLESLLRLLQRLPEGQRRVRFLFINGEWTNSAEASETYEAFSTRYGLSGAMPVTKEEHARLRRQWTALHWQEGVNRWRAVYRDVVSMLAPHVEVFTLHMYHPEAQSTVFPYGTELPVLRDLTFGRVGNPHELPALPNLRRLHVYGSTLQPPTVLSRFSDAHLDSLRFSGYDTFRDMSAHVQDGTICSLHELITTFERPKRDPYDGDFICGNAYCDDSDNNEEDMPQVIRCEPGGPRTVLLAPLWTYDDRYAKRDWKEVIQMEGDGAWCKREAPTSEPPATSSPSESVSQDVPCESESCDEESDHDMGF